MLLIVIFLIVDGVYVVFGDVFGVSDTILVVVLMVMVLLVLRV